jgi:hypothetical protein
MRSGFLARRAEAVFRQVAAMRLEMGDERGAPGVAGGDVAERVELERDAVGDLQLAQQLVGKGEQLDIRRRFPAPITSASSWWNWRKRPFCGRS